MSHDHFKLFCHSHDRKEFGYAVSGANTAWYQYRFEIKGLFASLLRHDQLFFHLVPVLPPSGRWLYLRPYVQELIMKRGVIKILLVIMKISSLEVFAHNYKRNSLS